MEIVIANFRQIFTSFLEEFLVLCKLQIKSFFNFIKI